MFKSNVSAKTFCFNRMRHCLILFFLREKFKNSFRGSRSRLKHIGYLSNLLDRLGEIPDILEERLNLSYLNTSFDGEKTT